eukprot:8628510-Pyramimonas_sp.AAC.1
MPVGTRANPNRSDEPPTFTNNIWTPRRLTTAPSTPPPSSSPPPPPRSLPEFLDVQVNVHEGYPLGVQRP